VLSPNRNPVILEHTVVTGLRDCSPKRDYLEISLFFILFQVFTKETSLKKKSRGKNLFYLILGNNNDKRTKYNNMKDFHRVEDPLDAIKTWQSSFFSAGFR